MRWPKLRAEVLRQGAEPDAGSQVDAGPGDPKSWQEMREWYARLLQARTGQDVLGVRGVKFAAYQAGFPGYVAATSPGDVIAFDLHTWHASSGGRDRLAWIAVYLHAPETDDERDRERLLGRPGA